MDPNSAGNQLALAHRQSGMMLIFTLALIIVLLLPLAGSALVVFAILSIPFCVLLVRGYYQRESWALPIVLLVWMGAIGVCFVYMLVEFSMLGGDNSSWNLIQGGLLLFLCWSMLQRLRMLRHPMFRAWYDGLNPAIGHDISLQAGEVLAACPHCSSLLAVKPMELHFSEKCPMCGERLVSQKSVEQYGILEEE
ncbi:MAG: hypothetical protein VYC11_00635 [Candidatus Thermoplasmatota archaeon]|nr:hypothetical protein [Candidatus Thermoplasmatota archaeon]|tara:strand:- start:304 stop:885 length:582 start_codon:yes stop_codon:yes gene_type:complete